MATYLGKGYFDGYNGSHFYLELWYELISQSTANNTSTFRLLSYVGSQDGYSGYGSTAYIYPHGTGIDSSVACGSYNSIPVNTKVGPGYSQNYTISHNSEGKLSLYVYTTTSNSWSGVGNASAGGTINFPDIARYPMIVQAPDFSDEDNPTITYTTTLGFTDATVQAGIFSSDGNTAYASYRNITVDDGSYTFQLSSSERSALRNASANSNSINVMFKIKTTTTSNVDYFSTSIKKMSIVNAIPTVTYTATEINSNVSALLGTSTDTIVQNASIVRFSVTPTALKGATISRVGIFHNNTYYEDTTTPYQLDIPVVTDSFTIRIIDSRNNTKVVSFTKTLIEYQPVDITNLSMRRVNPTSSNIILNLEAKYYQKTFGSTPNSPIVKWKLGDGSYTTIPSSAYSIDTTNNKLTITNYTLSNALIYTSDGQFTLYIEDLITNDTEGGQNGYVGKGIPTYDAGEYDFKVNGDLYIADTDGQNKVNVSDLHKVKITTDGNAVKTGRVIDNYDEYIKRISLNSFPAQNVTKTWDTGITMTNAVITDYVVMVLSSSGNWFKLPNNDTVNSKVQLNSDGKLSITIFTGNLNGQDGYADISYYHTS